MKYINLSLFLISLSVGLFICYVFPKHKTVYVFPTPENVKKLQYVDKGDNCFEFEKLMVPCQSANEIIDYEIQN